MYGMWQNIYLDFFVRILGEKIIRKAPLAWFIELFIPS